MTRPFQPRLATPTGAAGPLVRDAFGRALGDGGLTVDVDLAPRPYGPKQAYEPPRPIPPFGIAGGPPAADGPMGGSVTTPELIRARYTKALVTNPFQLTGASADLSGWVKYSIDRPMVLVPITFPLTGVLYSHPDRIPQVQLNAYRSIGPGILYLSHPGDWWLKYAGTGTIDVVLYDASDPAIAARFLQEPGTHYVTQTTSNVTSNITPTILLNRNTARRGILIQNLNADTSPMRIGLNNVVPTMTLGVRLSLQYGSSLTLTGDTLTKGAVLAVLESGAVPPGDVSVVEWI